MKSIFLMGRVGASRDAKESSEPRLLIKNSSPTLTCSETHLVILILICSVFYFMFYVSIYIYLYAIIILIFIFYSYVQLAQKINSKESAYRHRHILVVLEFIILHKLSFNNITPFIK